MGTLDSTVTIRETKQKKQVKITSRLKPKIVKSVVDKWQSLIDLAAKTAKVPSGLIMKLNEKTINVFLKSLTEGNPYEVDEEAPLIYGLYCETVIGTQQKLLVSDATKSKIWKENNPDVDLDMISYLGFPINWPDGEVFGTVCLLDNKENYYSETISEFLFQVKQHIETDLQLLVVNQNLKKSNTELEELNRIKSKYLSLISHDIRGGVSILNQFISLTLTNFDKYEKEELSTMLKIINQHTEAVSLALDNLLSWSKTDLLHLEPDKEQLNLVLLIEQILNYFKQALLLKEIEVVKEYYADPVYIHADKNMIISSLRNIISNAIKYNTANGKISIRLISQGKKTCIEIEDNGVGMNQKSVDKLFTYDKSHKKQGTYGESSAGIGLMITKDFLDKNNATVKVESEIGKGTKFTITI